MSATCAAVTPPSSTGADRAPVRHGKSVAEPEADVEHDAAPVVRRHLESGERHLDALTWGLVPEHDGVSTTAMILSVSNAHRAAAKS